jgi:plastocyanin
LSASFNPTTLTVTANTQVSFVNNSGVTHDVLFDGTRPPGVDDIGLHSSGTNVRTFTTAGTFNYHCDQHNGMNGTIIVN